MINTLMNTFTRRSILNKLFPATLLGVALPTVARAERQPHMQAALAALRRAQRELAAATADKGGHRVKAEELVRQAIGEVEAGISFDNRR